MLVRLSRKPSSTHKSDALKRIPKARAIFIQYMMLHNVIHSVEGTGPNGRHLIPK